MVCILLAFPSSPTDIEELVTETGHQNILINKIQRRNICQRIALYDSESANSYTKMIKTNYVGPSFNSHQEALVTVVKRPTHIQ